MGLWMGALRTPADPRPASAFTRPDWGNGMPGGSS
jgi:hypothetical protein